MRTHTTTWAAIVSTATAGLVLSVASIAQEQPAATPPPTSEATVTPAPGTVAVPAPAPATASPATPPRGATMDDVRSKFGAPSQESPAVGTPPITRWEYSGYVVYFEHDRVLHTVVVKS
jgi:hypothetical protein